MKRKIMMKALSLVIVLAVLCSVLVILPAAESESPESLRIAYCNLSFDNEAHLLYAVPSSNENLRLLVWHEPQGEYIRGTQTAELEPFARNVEIFGVPHTVFKYTGVTTKQVIDFVYARAYVNDDSGEYYGKVDKYSMLLYAYNKLGITSLETTDENLKNLLTTMLDYSAAAQVEFNYKADHPANGEWVVVNVRGGTLSDGFDYGLYMPGDTVTLTAPEMDENGWIFDYWYNVNDGNLRYGSTCEVTVGETHEEYVASYRQDSGDSDPTQSLQFASTGDGTCMLVFAGYPMEETLIIPETSPEGETVTAIGDGAFGGCYVTTSISIPDTVTSIGNYAFAGCGNLTTFTMPSALTSIGESAFADTGLSDISIPVGVTSIGNMAFQNCYNIQSISVAEGNPVYRAEGNCLIDIANNTLIRGCNNSVIPDSVTAIGASAFQGCTGFTSLTIPVGVAEIGVNAFLYCSNLEEISVVTGNERYSGVGNCLIETESGTLILGCKNSVIPTDGSVTSIGDLAFANCGLTGMEIPSGVTSIGGGAFSGCTSLVSITIPAGVVNIGADAFAFCTVLKNVEIPVGVETIEMNLFGGCEALESVTIPAGVTSIGDNAFSGCYSLTDIDIPDGVTSIGNYAFSGCSSLTSIHIPDSVTSIGDSAFIDCGATIFEIEDGVSYVGKWIVDCDESVTEVRLRTDTVGMVAGAFSFCYNLTKIDIPAGVTAIGNSMFAGCSELKTVTMSSNVTSIGMWAFSDCGNLVNINIPNSVTSIGDGAFRGCFALTTIVIPDGVQTLSPSLFGSCMALGNVTIPADVTMICFGVFDNCISLTDITFAGTMEEWEAIEKESDWDMNSGSYTLHCSNGDIPKP